MASDLSAVILRSAREIGEDFTGWRKILFTLPLVERRGRDDEPLTILTAVPHYEANSEQEFAPRLEGFFAAAAAISVRRPRPREHAKRERALIGVPLFGTGGGGAGRIPGVPLCRSSSVGVVASEVAVRI